MSIVDQQARSALTVVIVVASLAAPLSAQAPDADRDGDGLTDYQEVHKYGTNPDLADSDGDGIADGDWRERREYQYTVRSVVQVIRPVTVESLCDDHQDVRVLDETPTYVELEVVHYPFAAATDPIRGDPDWRLRAAGMPEWTRPGPTADWTPDLRAALVAALRGAGIEPDRLDDRTLVERASTWLLRRARVHAGFSTFVTAFGDDGRPYVPVDLRAAVERNAAARGLAVEAQWAREISARGMFEHRQRGTCSSTAIYLDGCLRALGVPTRIVLCIPLVDASDDRELQLVRLGLSNHAVRAQVRAAVGTLRDTWASHTFNEVFVGGRWRRLNGDELGQGIFDPKLFGLCTHVATFSDWADARMPETIGRRQQGGRPEDVFGGRNPYSTLALRDQFGVHCTRTNPRLRARLTSLASCDDPELPDDVRAWFVRHEVGGLVARVDGLPNPEALRAFLVEADPQLDLHLPGGEVVDVRLDPGTWWWKDGHPLVAVPMVGATRRHGTPGAVWRATPRNQATGAEWRPEGDLHLPRR